MQCRADNLRDPPLDCLVVVGVTVQVTDVEDTGHVIQ